MHIAENTVVSIHYTLKSDSGEVIDSSEGAEPLVYLHGAGNIIVGLESALNGKAQGDKVSVSIEPAQAYGERTDEMIHQVPRAQFSGVGELQAGMRFQAQTEEGAQVITVIEVGEEVVVVDANHPLAGETLHFDVEIVELREASETEIAHGHVHMPGDEE